MVLPKIRLNAKLSLELHKFCRGQQDVDHREVAMQPSGVEASAGFCAELPAKASTPTVHNVSDHYRITQIYSEKELRLQRVLRHISG
jgi:hypothetical protein